MTTYRYTFDETNNPPVSPAWMVLTSDGIECLARCFDEDQAAMIVNALNLQAGLWDNLKQVLFPDADELFPMTLESQNDLDGGRPL